MQILSRARDMAIRIGPPRVVGYEAWRAKEAKAGDEFADVWGPALQRGPAWEAVTATTLLQGGADVLVMCHPKAVEAVRNTIGQLVGEQPRFPLQDSDLSLLQGTLSQGAAR
jgi:CO dehydrogenase/acetyl-CoA synthase delta subunit